MTHARFDGPISPPGVTPAEARVRRAAVTLFAARSYAATGIRDLAKAAGVTSATLYHYTRSKEELLVALMIDGQRAVTDVGLRELDRRVRPEDRIAGLVGSLVAFHATNPLSTRVVDTEVRSLGAESEGRATVVALRDEYELLWNDAIMTGIDDGIFDVLDPHLARLSLLTMCAGMSNWYHDRPGDDRAAIARYFIDLALGSLRAKRNRRPVRADDVTAIDLAIIPRLASEPTPDDQARS